MQKANEATIYGIVNKLKLSFAAVYRALQNQPAVFVPNENCAVGSMLTLKQAGTRIPQDIAIAGFNNDPVSQVIEPNFTTINYPGYEMGEVAALQLINHLRRRERANYQQHYYSLRTDYKSFHPTPVN